MRFLPIIAGILLGLAFLAASVLYFLKVGTPPPPPEGSPIAMFMGAMYPTHYLDFVKVLEFVGAICIAIPASRRLGLLILGPIIVNIIAFHAFITKGEGLLDPMLLVIVACALYLLWVERRAFAAYVRGVPSPTPGAQP